MNDYARRMIMTRTQRRMDSRRGMDYGFEEHSREGADYARRAMDYARESADYARRAMDYAMRNTDMRLSDPIGTEPEYPHEMMWDGKQGVKGTGPYGIGGRLYSRGMDYDDDDPEMDGAHPSGLMRLKKKDFKKWESHLENADGTRGAHFDPQQVIKTAEQLGIQYDGYTERDLVMTANMLYSDLCKSIKQLRPDLPVEKEVIAYTKMAQDWLEDADAPVEGSEKLALYYWCIVKDEK